MTEPDILAGYDRGSPSEDFRLIISPEGISALIKLVKEKVLEELRAERLSERESSYLTIPEAAAFLRCRRQRIDDLLSQRRLSRFKDGRRTLVSREELDQHLRIQKTRSR